MNLLEWITNPISSINNALAGGFTFIRDWFITLLPASEGLPSYIETSLTTLLGYAIQWDYLVDISQLLLLLNLVFVFEAGILGFKVVKMIIRWVRGSG